MDTELTPATLQDLKERKNGAIAALVEKYSRTLFCGALGMGFSEADAEELVQDTLVAFLQALERFQYRSTVKTFLFGILYNKGSEFRRRERRHIGGDEAIDQAMQERFRPSGAWKSIPKSPEHEAENDELRLILARCSDTIPLNQRSALFLKEVEGESTSTICKILDVSATHLGVLLFRARNNMRECLERKLALVR